MLLVFICAVAYSLAARGLQPQSTAVANSWMVCASLDFGWAKNSEGESPCQVAAKVNGICNDNRWLIPALNNSVTYDVPIGGVASFCTCSWVSYNLISACMACQGYPYKIPSWTPYSTNCAGLFSETYFPANLTLPLTPFWATTNPINWPNERFDPTTAESMIQGHTDVGSALRSSPVVGGIVGGGIVLLAILGGILVHLRQ